MGTMGEINAKMIRIGIQGGYTNLSTSKKPGWRQLTRGAIITTAGFSERISHRRLAHKKTHPDKSQSAPTACSVGSGAPNPQSFVGLRQSHSTTITARAAASAPWNAQFMRSQWWRSSKKCRKLKKAKLVR